MSVDGTSGADEDDEEESWTFVGGDETDPDYVVKKGMFGDGDLSPVNATSSHMALGSRVLGFGGSAGAKSGMMGLPKSKSTGVSGLPL